MDANTAATNAVPTAPAPSRHVQRMLTCAEYAYRQWERRWKWRYSQRRRLFDRDYRLCGGADAVIYVSREGYEFCPLATNLERQQLAAAARRRNSAVMRNEESLIAWMIKVRSRYQ